MRAFARIDRETVLHRAAETAGLGGPLCGVPVAVKDLIDTCDELTEYGSPIYQGHRPVRDAAIVARLRELGAVIVGKTVTTEFALFAPPQTRNPHARERTPGGSSSGSAAAVAAGLVPVAIGTQTAGSIIRPAAYCGVVGLKPSLGWIDTEGVKALSGSFDTLGLLARSVDDAAIVYRALRRDEQHAVTLDVPRIGVCRTERWGTVLPDAQRVFEARIQHLRAAGIEVVELALDPLIEVVSTAQMALMEREVTQTLGVEFREHTHLLSPELRSYLAQAAGRSAASAAAAAEEIQEARAAFAAALVEVDAILTPATEGEAPTRDTTGDPWFSRAWTALGVPAITIPLGTGDAGLPIGGQLVARVGEEERLIAVAARIESLV